MSMNRMAVMAPALEHIAELIVFSFSDKISAENSKFSADSGIHGIQFLECMGESDTKINQRPYSYLAKKPPGLKLENLIFGASLFMGLKI